MKDFWDGFEDLSSKWLFLGVTIGIFCLWFIAHVLLGWETILSMGGVADPIRLFPEILFKVWSDITISILL